MLSTLRFQNVDKEQNVLFYIIEKSFPYRQICCRKCFSSKCFSPPQLTFLILRASAAYEFQLGNVITTPRYSGNHMLFANISSTAEETYFPSMTLFSHRHLIDCQSGILRCEFFNLLKFKGYQRPLLVVISDKY